MRHLRCLNDKTKMVIHLQWENVSTYECPKCGLRICINPEDISKLKKPYSENHWVTLTEGELRILEDEKVIFT